MPKHEDDSPSSTRLFDVAGLAEELKISPWLVGELRRRGILPKPLKLGALVRWRATDIALMLDRLGRAACVPRSMRGAVRRQHERRTGRIERVRLHDHGGRPNGGGRT